MKKNLLIVLIFMAMYAQAQVGIGTQNPNSNAVLDITSSNKGILLPRVSDTSKVNNPSEGLLIYNLNTKTPTFHNGTSWNSVSPTNLLPGGDSLTYTISGPGNPLFDNGSHAAPGISVSGTGGAPVIISLQKMADINSIGFVNSMQRNLDLGTIEFNMFSPGSATPYYSIKLTKWRILSMSKGSASAGTLMESYSIESDTIGYKDWVNNKSFSINQLTKAVGPY